MTAWFARAVAAALVLPLAPAGAQDALGSVEEALAAVEAGASLDDRVPAELATAAVARLEPSTTAVRLRGLASIAIAGGAQRPLAEHLVRIAIGDPGGPSDAALDVLRALPGEVHDEAASPVRGAWDAALLRLAMSEDERARSALALLARDATAEVLLPALGAGAAPGAGALPQRLRLLLALKTTRRPVVLLGALARVELDPALFEPFCATVASLVAGDPAAAERAVALAESGTWGWDGSLLRALGSIPPTATALRPRAEPLVLYALDSAEGPELVAAVIAATGLELPELGVILVQLARGNESREVRVTAIRALAARSSPDPGAIGLLIDLLSDPDVSTEAHRALVRTSGRSLPARPEAWIEWRHVLAADDEERTIAPAVAQPTVARAVVGPSSPPPTTPPPPTTATATPSAFPLERACLLLGLGAAVGAVLLIAWRRHPAPPVPATPEGPASAELSATATRLDRLKANLDREAAAVMSYESDAQVSLIREALREVPLQAEGATGSPDASALRTIEALREVLVLGRRLEGGVLDSPFEAFRAEVERVERFLSAEGFTERCHESCYLVLQVAHCLSHGRPVSPVLRERLEAALRDLAARVDDAGRGRDVRTVKVAEVFPDVARPAPDPGSPCMDEGPTLDALTCSPTASPSARATLALSRSPAAVDSPTLAVSPHASVMGEGPTTDVAALGATRDGPRTLDQSASSRSTAPAWPRLGEEGPTVDVGALGGPLADPPTLDVSASSRSRAPARPHLGEGPTVDVGALRAVAPSLDLSGSRWTSGTAWPQLGEGPTLDVASLAVPSADPPTLDVSASSRTRVPVRPQPGEASTLDVGALGALGAPATLDLSQFCWTSGPARPLDEGPTLDVTALETPLGAPPLLDPCASEPASRSTVDVTTSHMHESRGGDVL